MNLVVCAKGQAFDMCNSQLPRVESGVEQIRSLPPLRRLLRRAAVPSLVRSSVPEAQHLVLYPHASIKTPLQLLRRLFFFIHTLHQHASTSLQTCLSTFECEPSLCNHRKTAHDYACVVRLEGSIERQQLTYRGGASHFRYSRILLPGAYASTSSR